MSERKDAPAPIDDAGLRLRMRGEERRIASQHDQLDELCAAVSTRIDREGALASLGSFLRLVAALDAHMTLEEEIYFPALHGLRAGIGAELESLIAGHRSLRSDAAEIRKMLWSDERQNARFAIDRLAKSISKHELREEALIARVMHPSTVDSGTADSDSTQGRGRERV